MIKKSIRQDRIDARDYASQVFCWCIICALHQCEGIGAQRLERACHEMEAFQAKYQSAILYNNASTATRAMQEELKDICDLDVHLPVLKAPRGSYEQQMRMAKDEGGAIAWLVLAATCRETFGFGSERLARLKEEALKNYRQYLEWDADDHDYALYKLQQNVSQALREELTIVEDEPRDTLMTAPGIYKGEYSRAVTQAYLSSGRKSGLPLAVLSPQEIERKINAATRK